MNRVNDQISAVEYSLRQFQLKIPLLLIKAVFFISFDFFSFIFFAKSIFIKQI